MTKKVKNSILTMAFLCTFFVGGNIAQASFPSIISVSATPIVSGISLNASINPNGRSATAWFEYSNSNYFINYNETPHTLVNGANYASYVFQTVSNLNPNTTYYFRAVSDNGENTVRSNVISATTLAQAFIPTNPTLNNTDDVMIVHIDGELPKLNDKITPNTTIPKTIKKESSSTSPTEDKKVNQAKIIDGTQLGANAIFGNDFLPNTLIGWSILILIILFIVLTFRKLKNI